MAKASKTTQALSAIFQITHTQNIHNDIIIGTIIVETQNNGHIRSLFVNNIVLKTTIHLFHRAS